MTTKKEMSRLIIEYCKALRLPSIRRLFEAEIAEASLSPSKSPSWHK